MRGVVASQGGPERWSQIWQDFPSNGFPEKRRVCNSSGKGGSRSEAYRHKNSAEKRRRLLLGETKSQLTPSLTRDHPNPHQIDPNVPVFLENVVFFELERRPGSENRAACTQQRTAADFSWTPAQDNSFAEKPFHEISKRYRSSWNWSWILSNPIEGPCL